MSNANQQFRSALIHPYQSFLKNIACKCQCLWPNLYIFSVIYSYPSFFFFFFVHFLYSFAQFCSAVMEEANAVELRRCFSATENKNRTFFILSSLKSHHESFPSGTLMKTPVFNAVFAHTFAEPEIYIQITQVVFNKLYRTLKKKKKKSFDTVFIYLRIHFCYALPAIVHLQIQLRL